MARIAGVNIPNHKHAEIALTAIYGIGRNTAKQICLAAGVSATTKIKDLNDAEVEKLRDQIAKESTVDWWLAHASDPATDQAKQMAEVLAAERTGQARLVEGALAVVQEALSHLDPVLDDPNVLRSQQFEI